MDLAVIVEAFVVVVVGGMGSVAGAFLAALLIAQLHAFGILILPKITLVLMFLVMALVLIVRPHGLLGREAPARAEPSALAAVLRPASPRLRAFAAAALVFAIAAPLVADDYALTVMTDMAVMVLFAASLHFLMGPAGMTSFGHAAYFGIGAYAAALAMKQLAAPIGVTLALAPFAAGIAGIAFGWFCVRLSGVYLAMLTLAFAQIAWSVAFQWVEFTGGDNGILGVWPPEALAGKAAYYHLTLVLCVLGTLALRLMLHGSLGYSLRGVRDSRARAESIGIPAMSTQWLGFAIAASFAGLAGALFAHARGSVFPTYMAISRSVDALVMVLLGGVHSLSGPIVGALAYVVAQEQLVRLSDAWRAVLGLSIIALVMAFPRGLAGIEWRGRKGAS
jgi:branched-chain amino acid transport system permease protein